MPKRPSAYHRPENLSDALRLLAKPNHLPLAGGTKLIAADVSGVVVDLQALGLNKIEQREEYLHIGATTRLTNLDEALAAQEESGLPAALLRTAIKRAGPNTYRNAATVGGMVASQVAESELLAAMLVLEAQVRLLSPEEVTLSLVEYLDAAAPVKGLITEILIPWQPGKGGIERVARTPADAPIVAIVLWQPEQGRPKLAGVGLNDRPALLDTAAEKLASGLSQESISSAAAAAKASTQHPGDFRGDTGYRADMAEVLTRRVCAAVSGSAG